MLVFRPLYLTLDSVVPATHFQRIQPALSIFINSKDSQKAFTAGVAYTWHQHSLENLVILTALAIKITLSQALLSLQALLPLLWTKSR